jgi:hypothetical protein
MATPEKHFEIATLQIQWEVLQDIYDETSIKDIRIRGVLVKKGEVVRAKLIELGEEHYKYLRLSDG